MYARLLENDFACVCVCHARAQFALCFAVRLSPAHLSSLALSQLACFPPKLTPTEMLTRPSQAPQQFHLPCPCPLRLPPHHHRRSHLLWRRPSQKWLPPCTPRTVTPSPISTRGALPRTHLVLSITSVPPTPRPPPTQPDQVRSQTSNRV